MKKLSYTTENIKQVFLRLSCNYWHTYWSLEQETKIPENILKKVIKELKELWVIEVNCFFNEDTWKLAWRWFYRLSDFEIKKDIYSWRITPYQLSKFKLLMD